MSAYATTGPARGGQGCDKDAKEDEDWECLDAMTKYPINSDSAMDRTLVPRSLSAPVLPPRQGLPAYIYGDTGERVAPSFF